MAGRARVRPPSTRSPGPSSRGATRRLLEPVAELRQRRGARRPGHGRRPRACVVGRPRLLARHGLSAARRAGGRRGRRRAAGRTAVAVGWDGRARGVLVVADTVKPTSAEAVAELRALGLRPSCSPATTSAAARAVAAEVGIDEVVAEVLPAGKVDVVKRPAGRGPGRGDGRRRGQRRGRARPGRPRPRHGHRHRRGDRGQRPHPGARGPARRRRRGPAVAADPAPRSRATCSGRSPTTWPRCRWPPPGCSTR